MENVNFIKKNINELVPASYNPRVDLQEFDPEYQKLKRSIETFGYVENVVFNKRTGNIVGGHQRVKVLKDLGYEEIIVSEVDLSLEQEKALNIGLNKISGDWDNDLLKSLLIDLQDNDFDISLTGFDTEEIESLFETYLENEEERERQAEEDKYTTKIDIPQYQITGKKPTLDQMLDQTKVKELVKEIEKADISKEEKTFLLKATTRHYTFNYKHIAEYYAHASKEVQELMEQSALVIIDYNDSIKNGYTTLRAEVEEMWREEYANEYED